MDSCELVTAMSSAEDLWVLLLFPFNQYTKSVLFSLTHDLHIHTLHACIAPVVVVFF